LTVTEALKIIQKGSQAGPAFDILLACGCTPLHLRTFLQAHLQQALPQRKVSVSDGLYGDLSGTLERAAGKSLAGIAVVLEWADLDQRLGYRSAAPWNDRAARDILTVAEATLQRLDAAIARIPREVRVALSPPTLPLPPLFHTAGWQASEMELLLDQKISSFLVQISNRAGLTAVNPLRLAQDSAFAARLDLKSELLIGFPYTLAHAEALAGLCARLLAPPARKKGIITDLDDTLWSGIVGEVGPEGVSWDLSQHQHLHALYQNLLSSLADAGVLVGVASKNDAATVEKAFQRDDILLSAPKVFPLEVHWGAKSKSVERILETWNITADSVIMVDDSPMELAEVAAAHPGIHCIPFPKGDYSAGLAMLRQIRDLCGSERISAEDSLRLESIRQGAEFRRLTEDGSVPEDFLAQADAAITFDFCPAPEDSRVLELVNKTNQFNLNGVRRTETDWNSVNQQPESIVGVLSYKDKFGPLGKIAVFQGSRNGDTLSLNTWVMSCRAFSRRVEHQCLRVLFDRFGLSEIVVDFAPTAKNRPTQDFLETLTGSTPIGKVSLTRQQFDARCPVLYHRVILEKDGDKG
jgi:FkbH-like protein